MRFPNFGLIKSGDCTSCFSHVNSFFLLQIRPAWAGVSEVRGWRGGPPQGPGRPRHGLRSASQAGTVSPAPPSPSSPLPQPAFAEDLRIFCAAQILASLSWWYVCSTCGRGECRAGKPGEAGRWRKGETETATERQKRAECCLK